MGSGGGEAEGGKLRQFRQEYLQPAGRVGQLRGKRGVVVWSVMHVMR